MAEEYDEEEEGGTFNTTEGISAYFVLFSTLLALVLVLSKYLHDRPRLASLLPEAGMILIVGMLAGSFVHLFVDQRLRPPDYDDYETYYYSESNSKNASVAQSLLSFSPKVFFIALLPPIIFNSGYHLRRELFFRHIAPIVLLAVVGTIVSTIGVAALLELAVRLDWVNGFAPTWTELLAFGALISATDTVSTLAVFQTKKVDPHLFYLVFGESVLNDAVGLVLFKVFAGFVVPHNGAIQIIASFGEFLVSFCLNAFGSPVLGLLCGVAAAALFKHVDMRQHKLLELSLYVLIVYVPFLLAELIHLSGIVTILFTGMVARSFVVPNLSTVTANTAESLFRLVAHLAETAIFLELGLSMFGLVSRHNLNWRFLLWSILACLVGRALSVYPLSWCFNVHLQRKTRRHEQQLSMDNNGHNNPAIVLVDNLHEMMKRSLAESDHHTSVHERDQVQVAPTTSTADDQSSVTPRVKRDLKITPQVSHMLWMAGLRGAMSYACSRSFPNAFGHRQDFVIATMGVVLATVFGLGGTTEMALKCLKVPVNVDEAAYMREWHQQRKQDGFILTLEELVNRHAVRGHDKANANANDADQDDDDDNCDDGQGCGDGEGDTSSIRRDTTAGPRRNRPRTASTGSAPSHVVEVSESLHFERLEAMGYVRDYMGPLRNAPSLFDFGGETR